jgi:LacI family transcriptional regulator
MSPKDTAPEARVTIRTVAADAGVSVAAVSKVLRNAYGVSEALRARVNASIEKLGYRPSKAAQGLRGRSTAIGVLLVEVGNPFLPSIIDGIQDALAPSHWQAMIGVGRSQTHLETELIESMIDHGMAGLILVAPMLPSVVVSRYAQRLPIVLVAYHDPSSALFDTVNGDDHLGAIIATEALLERGHRDIGFLAHQSNGERWAHVQTQRELGYRRAMAAAGLEPRVFDLTAPSEGRPGEIRAFLERPDRPRAVFCWSDLDALPLRGLAHQVGLRVPEDLAIVGYDNSPMCASPLVNLASIDQSGRELGASAAQALLSRLAGRRDPLRILVEPRLVVRPSLG